MPSGYLAYRDMMAEIDGGPTDKEARAKLWSEKGITSRDLRWEGPENEGNGTVIFQHGKPVYLMWYEWNITYENLMASLQKDLGGLFLKLVDVRGGNGHYSAGLDVIG